MSHAWGTKGVSPVGSQGWAVGEGRWAESAKALRTEQDEPHQVLAALGDCALETAEPV